MAKTITKKISIKYSTAKPLGKPPSGNKTIGIDPAIRFHAIEEDYYTEEGEELEIRVIYNSSLTASKQNLVKRKFPYIDTFDNEGPTLFSAVHNLTIGLFEHLEITSPIKVYKRVAYMQRILRGSAFKKYEEVLVACRKLEKELVVDEWNLGELSGISAEAFWTWTMADTTGYDGHAYLTLDKCINFKRELWFELVKCMGRKPRSVYQDHIKYIRNDIVKPFHVKILRYSERIGEMHDLAKYLPPPSIKGESA